MKNRRLTAAEEIELARRIQEHDDADALNELVECNMGLVVFVAQKIPSWHLDGSYSRDDMVQVGNMALLRAARTWKPQNRFATYARKLIFSSIMRDLENFSQLIRIPVPVQEKIRKLKKTESQLVQQLGREPDANELAAATDIPLDQVRDLILVSQRQPISLDAYHRENATEGDEYE